jgi:hypothetical protein
VEILRTGRDAALRAPSIETIERLVAALEAVSREKKEHDAIGWVRRIQGECDAEAPSIYYEMDGGIGLDWGCGQRVLSVSFNNDGTVIYAGLYDGEKIHGHKPVDEAWTILDPWMRRSYELAVSRELEETKGTLPSEQGREAPQFTKSDVALLQWIIDDEEARDRGSDLVKLHVEAVAHLRDKISRSLSPGSAPPQNTAQPT